MGIIMQFIGISKKNNAQKREHNLLKPTKELKGEIYFEGHYMYL